MTDVHALLAAFIAEDRGPVPADPRAYLDRVDGLDRSELELLIDAYLKRAPRRAVDPERLRAGDDPAVPLAARALAQRLERAETGVSGTWPLLLPQLREAARIQRRALVDALAQRLDVADESDRVAGYYHQMEHGLLPANGVSDRVLAALGALLGHTAAALRAAGETLAGAPSAMRPDGLGAGAAAFARTATPDRTKMAEQDDLGTPAPQPGRSEGASRVDQLFTGGAGAGGGRERRER